MLQLYLIGPARTWISDLPENSIFCWFDLKIAFEKHFRDTYKSLPQQATCKHVSRKKAKLHEICSLDG
jgi:hypothetical protein